MNEPKSLPAILDFLESVDAFKSIERAAYLSDGTRHETDSDHAWHMALFAVLLHRELDIECDLQHALELILVHDLVEIHAGDAPAFDLAANEGKTERERRAADRLFSVLPEGHGSTLRAWWDEFEKQRSSEARFALAMDRLQVLAQNVASGGRAWKDYGVTRPRVEERNAPVIEWWPGLRPTFEALYDRADARDCWG
ncbi:MAG: HD domain-containing protein [Actinomycetota bacterium]